MFDSGVIWLGEIRCQSLLGVNKLSHYGHPLLSPNFALNLYWTVTSSVATQIKLRAHLQANFNPI